MVKNVPTPVSEKELKKDIKIFFVRDHVEGAVPDAFEVFIVNTSATRTYKDIKLESVAIFTDDNSSSPTNKVFKTFGDLKPLSSLSIDLSDVWELDMYIDYRVFLEEENQARHKLFFSFKGSPEGELKNVLGTSFNGVELDYDASWR